MAFTLITTEKGLQALQVIKTGRKPKHHATEKQENTKLTYPYFKQQVPKELIDTSNPDYLYPTEWVGWISQSKTIFVQVAYPILPDDFESYEETEIQGQLSYKVFVSEDDYAGIDVRRANLVKLVKPSTEGSNWVAAGAEITPSLPKSNFEQSENNEQVGLTWMNQVEIDFQTLQHLQYACEDCPKDLNWYGTACFLAQQVAEKALTGGICFFSGSDVNGLNRFKSHRLHQRIMALKPYKKYLVKTTSKN